MPATGDIATDWQMARLPAGQAATPDALPPDTQWIPARAPGTAAAALREAGIWDGAAPLELDQDDIWFRAVVIRAGPHLLQFQGLATLTEIWLDGVTLGSSGTMFRPHEHVAVLRDGAWLHLRFRSLGAALQGRRGRPRWRPRMIQPPSLRAVRTTLLGHMPGWCPPVQAVGPWRPIRALALTGAPQPRRLVIRPVLRADGAGQVTVEASFTDAALTGQPASLRLGDRDAPLAWAGTDVRGVAVFPDIQPWWPHTHGAPVLHNAALRVGDHVFPLPPMGFRRLELDRGADGQAVRLRVNGVAVFCRGANWITADLVALPDGPDACAPALRLACAAGLNMLRVPGVAVYESSAFYAACDRLGLLVWQDAMFANFDYPADAAFLDEAQAEVAAFLARTAHHACLAVFCGGSEIMQQAAMMGVPEANRAHPLFDTLLPATVAAHRPDLVAIRHSPDGPDLPFLTRQGVSHYYGVGAYQRPLDDARRAGVRFASECLAFANVPDEPTLERSLPGVPVGTPRWKAGIPRDAGVAWDFEDVRDHYLAQLYGVDPARLRYADPERYLLLSRAVVADVVEATLAEWRRPGSGCDGALLWTLQDVQPGAGWGIIDSLGQPKSVWHALRRTCQPLAVLITDEALNGLDVHVVNDRDQPVAAVLRLDCLADGLTVVAGGERSLRIPARNGVTINSAMLLPHFFDLTDAYRFGPPAHDVTVVTLTDAETGALLAEACHFPAGRERGTPCQLTAGLTADDTGWMLQLRADRLARHVHVTDRAFRPDESWFHLRGGTERLIRLSGPPGQRPAGWVSALHAARSVRYGDG